MLPAKWQPFCLSLSVLILLWCHPNVQWSHGTSSSSSTIAESASMGFHQDAHYIPINKYFDVDTGIYGMDK